MTDDLVKRLHESAQAWDNEGECGLATLEREAAYCIKDQQKRIKQLEAALHKFRSIPQGKYTVWIKDDSTVAWKSEGAFMFFDGDRKYTIAWEKRDD
jgi:hypothetical protein